MNRKAEIFFDAITCLREDLVEEAQNYTFHRRRTLWRRYAGMAACLALAACLGWYGLIAGFHMGGMGGGNMDPSADAIVSGDAAPAEPDAPAAAESDSSFSEDGGEPDPCPDTASFLAEVLEVEQDWLLVKPYGGGLFDSCETVQVLLEEMPVLEVGDPVRILYTACDWTGETPVVRGTAAILEE